MKKGFRMLSNVGNDRHCICALDYDDVSYENLTHNLLFLQEFFDLDSFHIFETKKDHYSCVCFSVLTANMLTKLLKLANVDKKQKAAFSKLRCIGFRLSKKHKRFLPKLIDTLERTSSTRKQADTHILIFTGLYPLMTMTELIEGNFNDVTFEEYKLKR